MYDSYFHASNYYASLYYAALRGDRLGEFNRLSLHDIQYEALSLVVSPVTDARSMEREYWLGLFGGRGSTADIVYEGIILGLGFPDMKAYYDNQTSKVWPDANSSEKAYWLKTLVDNS